MGQNYQGSVYTGVVGPETDYSKAWRSILDIQKRPGDSFPQFFKGTKGYELRQMHINKFIDSEHDFILMLDHDMTFEPDTLERLRSWGKPYVSGLYMRRQFDPIAPIWFTDNPDGLWPSEPYVTDPERGRLHKIGASGWGCVLIHREVILNTRPLLKGEPEVIEDDMDIWPYDLDTVFTALENGDLDTLRNEIRPLRGDKIPVGSDIRFPYFAKAAGYQMYGDPDVRPGHILYYPLTPDDFSGTPDDYRANLLEATSEKINSARGEWLDKIGRLT